MKLVIFTHPGFLELKSMDRFSRMIADEMSDRGNEVEVITAQPWFFRLPVPLSLKKWMGYIDQYIVFPFLISRKLKRKPKDTLFIFSDHALGPWVGLVQGRKCVVHCHDFLAQRSALGLIPEKHTAVPGRYYQRYIRQGFQKSRHFISVSEKTRTDLEWILKEKPVTSVTCYNALDSDFLLLDPDTSRRKLGSVLDADLSKGFILHVGGNQWYKNRLGVIAAYDYWRFHSEGELPLIMIGACPSPELEFQRSISAYCSEIHFLENVSGEVLNFAYSGATLLFFPSLAEGFGWPIIEAMASGTIVVTTSEAPMTEVAADAAFYVPVFPLTPALKTVWFREVAAVLDEVTQLDGQARHHMIRKGILNSERFDKKNCFNEIERIYTDIIND